MYADLAVDEQTGAAATLRRYVFAPGYGSAGLAAWRENGEWCVAHADMLGSTRVVSNGAGAAANGLAYAAFGELATSSAPSNALYKTRYGFCGAWGYESDYLSDGTADPLAGASSQSSRSKELHLRLWVWCSRWSHHRAASSLTMEG